jgi:hypothetical protein
VACDVRVMLVSLSAVGGQAYDVELRALQEVLVRSAAGGHVTWLRVA